MWGNHQKSPHGENHPWNKQSGNEKPIKTCTTQNMATAKMQITLKI
jgi:hypothetical protein